MKRWKINWTLWRTTRKFERQAFERNTWITQRDRAIEIIHSSCALDQAMLRMTRRGRDVLWYAGYLRQQFAEQLMKGEPVAGPLATSEEELQLILAQLAERNKEPNE